MRAATVTLLLGLAVCAVAEMGESDLEEIAPAPEALDPGSCRWSASYTIVNSCVWSRETHPTDYPGGSAHWSPLCGTSHSALWQMYEEGQVTIVDGVKEVAETGSCAVLEESIDACAQEEQCTQMVRHPCDAFNGTCDHVGKISVDEERPYVSLISMVAPSPDWVVGISGVQLCEDGNWKKEYTTDLFALDAGTDSGTTFTSRNKPTEPWEPVTRFEALDKSNIFWHPKEKVLNKLCTITLTLD